jgi:hypothetical protein
MEPKEAVSAHAFYDRVGYTRSGYPFFKSLAPTNG